MELTQDLSYHLGMRVSPRLVAASYVLGLSSMELQQAIAEELSDNPAMELVETSTCPACGGPMQGKVCPACLSELRTNQVQDDDRWDSSDDNHDLSFSSAVSDDDFDPLTQVAAQDTLPERLLQDLQAMLPESSLPIANYLVGNLGDNGYLQCSTDEVAYQLGVRTVDVELVLEALQSLDPIGIGSRDLRECLLIQIDYLRDEGVECSVARRIVDSHLPDLAEHKFSKLANELGVSLDAIVEASEFIRHRLNPSPAHGYVTVAGGLSERRVSIVLPDVIISQVDAENFDVDVIESKRFFVRIVPSYQQLAARLKSEPDALSDDERHHVKHYVSRAKLFLDNIRQRRETLQKITRYIVEAQKEFLLNGIRSLTPLTRATVASQLGLHESTVSRATASKYVMLPNRKVIPFSDFFTASLSVMDVIKEIVAGESSPLTDSAITDELARRGIVIARRTVAKYREHLGILPSSLR